MVKTLLRFGSKWGREKDMTHSLVSRLQGFNSGIPFRWVYGPLLTWHSSWASHTQWLHTLPAHTHITHSKTDCKLTILPRAFLQICLFRQVFSSHTIHAYVFISEWDGEWKITHDAWESNWPWKVWDLPVFLPSPAQCRSWEHRTCHLWRRREGGREGVRGRRGRQGGGGGRGEFNKLRYIIIILNIKVLT